MVEFLDMFCPVKKGNYGLTDEAIYKSLQQFGDRIPVWGAYKEHINPIRYIPKEGRTIENKPITIFSGEGIIINFDGVSAGRMTYKKNETFALNHHTGFTTVKDGCEYEIVPEFFALFYQNQLQNASVSSDQSTLTMKTLYSMDFDIPSYENQCTVMDMIRPLLAKRKRVRDLLVRLEIIKARTIYQGYSGYQDKEIPISEILECAGVNAGLTESEIYKRILTTGKRYSVLSSSTEERTRLGEIPKCVLRTGKELRVFEGKDGILVIRNGKAGTTFYLPSGNYTTTDHAYILFETPNCPYKISIKWLIIQYRSKFLEFSSSSDNGTWNKTGFFNHVAIDIPQYQEQLKIVEAYGAVERLEVKLNNINEKIDTLLSKSIVA